MSFVFSGRPQRLLVETGLLRGVPYLCLLEMAGSVRKYCRFNANAFALMARIVPFLCLYKGAENCKLLKRFGVPDGI